MKIFQTISKRNYLVSVNKLHLPIDYDISLKIAIITIAIAIITIAIITNSNNHK